MICSVPAPSSLIRNNWKDGRPLPAVEPAKFEENTEIVKLSKGTLICFPSHLWHRVKPVTEGTRYSLTTWYLGQPFK